VLTCSGAVPMSADFVMSMTALDREAASRAFGECEV
jgi:hypothetical protein